MTDDETQTEAERTFEAAVRAAVRSGVIDVEGIARTAAQSERDAMTAETAAKVYGESAQS